MLQLQHLSKSFQELILDDINLTFEDTGLYVIVGASGSGKSTLLSLIGGLDSDYQGTILYQNQDIRNINNYIRQYVSFVFQNNNLVDELSISKNYQLPSYFKRVISRQEQQQYLKKLDMQSFIKNKMVHISGGQKQRVAFMRAIVADSPIILCDEPTGALDNQQSRQVYQLMKNLAKDHLVIVITHDTQLASIYHDYLLELKDHHLILKHQRHRHKPNIIQKGRHQRPFLFYLIEHTRLSWKNYVIMTPVIMISLLCVLMTFSMSQASRKQIKKQVEQVLPVTQVLARRKDQSLISINECLSFDLSQVSSLYLENSQVEMMGLSLQSNYQQDQTLYINDCTKMINQDDIKKGRLYQNENEIVVSLSTYQHLQTLFKQKNILNQTFHLWYRYGIIYRYVDITIVGYSDDKTLFDTMYFLQMSNMKHTQSLFDIDKGDIMIINMQDKPSLKELSKTYLSYEFQISSQQLTKTIDQQFDQLEMILLSFCSLAVVSCCFLIGEVLYLMVIRKKRLFAILQSVGASRFQVMMIVFFQGFIIVHIAFINAFLLMYQLSFIINDLVKEFMNGIIGDFLVIDYSMIIIVYLFTVLLTIISCWIPSLTSKKISIIEGLKG